MSYAIRRVDEPADDSIAEEWTRAVGEPRAEEVHGASAHRTRTPAWPWHVTVSAMEFVREEPLESTLRERVAGALREVAGVEGVEEEDREVWVVSGSPSGEALVAAVAEVVDALADEIRAHIDGLG
jgi:hypothetical protein